MASWHVPVHDESVSEEFLEDDLFDDNLELTFPPLRYCAVNQATSPQKLRRESSRERDRLYRELVGHAPYVAKQRKGKDNKFYVALDVKHYKPEEITIKVDGRQLLVSAKHYNATENGFEASEFHRKYAIPENIDPHTLTSNITSDGVLYIKAVEAPPHLDERDGNKDSDKFVLTMDVNGYRPDEISIRVRGNTLIVHGEMRDENANTDGPAFHHQQFTRNFSLPYDLNMEALSSRYTKDEKITIEAPRGLNTPMRELEIKED